jgi:hypothetical protein
MQKISWLAEELLDCQKSLRSTEVGNSSQYMGVLLDITSRNNYDVITNL